MRNIEIRTEAIRCGVKLYQIAAACGMRDNNFSRMLRNELPEDEKTKILSIIHELSGGGVAHE